MIAFLIVLALRIDCAYNNQSAFYFARHTFANVLKTQGHSVEMIKELIGHSDIRTTQIYLGSFDDPTRDKVMDDLL